MADATIDLTATDHFGMAAYFQTQSSTTSATTAEVNTLDEFGNVECEKNIGGITEYSTTYTYCGNSFSDDIIGVTGIFEGFGRVVNEKVMIGVTLNMNAGEYATIEITGHQHDVNPHENDVIADVSDFLPHETGESFNGWDGFGVPDFGINYSANSSPSSATVTFTMAHIDSDKETGDHLVGKNTQARCELSMSFEGDHGRSTAQLQSDMRANTLSMLNVTVDTDENADSNSAFDTSGFTAHAYVDVS